jgi:hypothetical protein
MAAAQPRCWYSICRKRHVFTVRATLPVDDRSRTRDVVKHCTISLRMTGVSSLPQLGDQARTNTASFAQQPRSLGSNVPPQMGRAPTKPPPAVNHPPTVPARPPVKPVPIPAIKPVLPLEKKG